MAKRGAFIVIEGLDRSGKSTQTSLLHDRLKDAGESVQLLKFPGQLF
jgi:dTMP kinase